MQEVDITFLDGGYCTHPERMTIRDGRLKTVTFPSIFNLIRHPTRGNILFDTGYSRRFYEETQRYPERLYARITPAFIRESDVAVAKLAQLGVQPHEVDYVILSHFHADHVGAVKDFPKARYIYLRSAWDHVRRLSRLRAVTQGVLPGLLPDDFERRSQVIDDSALRASNDIPLNDAFTRVFDIFGDRSLYAVDLPGHMRGQMGLFLRDADREFFLIADACWLSRSYRELVLPSRLAMGIVDSEEALKDTLTRIHRVYEAHPDMVIAPSHCGEIYRDLVQHKSHRAEETMNGLPHPDGPMLARTLRTSIDIDAPADVVWEVLTALDRYHEWNPFVLEASGTIAPGELLRLRPRLPGSRRQLNFQATVTSYERGAAFAWTGVQVHAAVVAGEHIFRLTPLAAGRTRLDHDEVFSGLLAPLAMTLGGEKTRRGFEMMNEAAARRAEALAARRAP